MTLAQKLKRLRELLLDSAVREEVESALRSVIQTRGAHPLAATNAVAMIDTVAEALEIAQENVAEARS